MTDVSREMLAASAHEDPLELGKQCGMIQNKNVKVCRQLSFQLRLLGASKLISILQRRTGPRPPQPAATSTGPSTTAPSKTAVPAKPQSKTEDPKPGEATESKQPPQKESNQPPPKPTGKAAPLKKEKSNLFSSFAKAKPKQKKEEPATPASSAEDC